MTAPTCPRLRRNTQFVKMVLEIAPEKQSVTGFVSESYPVSADCLEEDLVTCNTLFEWRTLLGCDLISVMT